MDRAAWLCGVRAPLPGHRGGEPWVPEGDGTVHSLAGAQKRRGQAEIKPSDTERATVPHKVIIHNSPPSSPRLLHSWLGLHLTWSLMGQLCESRERLLVWRIPVLMQMSCQSHHVGPPPRRLQAVQPEAPVESAGGGRCPSVSLITASSLSSGIQWTLNARLSELVLLAYACCQEAATVPAHGKRHKQ